MKLNRKSAIKADEEVLQDTPVEVDPSATDLLFEAEDVAELLAEATQQPVDVEADGDTVNFTIGEDTFTVEAEGDEEIVESSTKVLRGRAPVRASKAPAKKVTASTTARKFRTVPHGQK